MSFLNNEDREMDAMFHGEEKPLHPDTVHVTLGKPFVAVSKKETPTTVNTSKVAENPKGDPVEAQWEPTKEHTWMDGLIACAKWALLFGGLSLLIFYWKQSGLMAESIAVPCIAVCTALGGWGVGKNAVRGNR